MATDDAPSLYDHWRTCMREAALGVSTDCVSRIGVPDYIRIPFCKWRDYAMTLPWDAGAPRDMLIFLSHYHYVSRYDGTRWLFYVADDGWADRISRQFLSDSTVLRQFVSFDRWSPALTVRECITSTTLWSGNEAANIHSSSTPSSSSRGGGGGGRSGGGKRRASSVRAQLLAPAVRRDGKRKFERA